MSTIGVEFSQGFVHRDIMTCGSKPRRRGIREIPVRCSSVAFQSFPLIVGVIVKFAKTRVCLPDITYPYSEDPLITLALIFFFLFFLFFLVLFPHSKKPHPPITMATALLPATLTAGPYVIRNCEFGIVLHLQVPRSNPDIVGLYACPQDENLFPSQQIWWIEPLAHHNAAAEHELVYSITCTGRGKALDGSMGSGTTRILFFAEQTLTCSTGENQARGVPTRLWALKTAVDLFSGHVPSLIPVKEFKTNIWPVLLTTPSLIPPTTMCSGSATPTWS